MPRVALVKFWAVQVLDYRVGDGVMRAATFGGGVGYGTPWRMTS
jgi:hypothetical protein